MMHSVLSFVVSLSLLMLPVVPVALGQERVTSLCQLDQPRSALTGQTITVSVFVDPSYHDIRLKEKGCTAPVFLEFPDQVDPKPDWVLVNDAPLQQLNALLADSRVRQEGPKHRQLRATLRGRLDWVEYPRKADGKIAKDLAGNEGFHRLVLRQVLSTSLAAAE
jgi:hypothetical protein